VERWNLQKEKKSRRGRIFKEDWGESPNPEKRSGRRKAGDGVKKKLRRRGKALRPRNPQKGIDFFKQ